MKSETKQIKLKSTSSAMLGYFLILSVLLIVLFDIVFYFVVAAALEDQARGHIVMIGSEAVLLIEKTPDERIEELEDGFLRRADEGITVYLIASDGTPIIPEDGSFTVPEERLSELRGRLAESEMVEYLTFRTAESVNYATRVNFWGESYLFVSYSLRTVRGSIATAQIYLILISVAVLALAVIIAWSFSQKLSRGFKSMSDAAVSLARGDYSVKFMNADYREVAQLSDTLNYVRDEVKKSGDFQREILANVTHDLKTPLTMIKAYASMVKEISGDNPEKREKHLQVIIDEADRLTTLVDDVLSVSKVNSNLGELNEKVFNLTEFLYGIIAKFDYLQEGSGYSFMVDIDEIYTRADEEKIGQVIYNLLGNAISYTGVDKTVYISLKSSLDGKRAKFSVRDTGKGIPQSELPNIWDRYYRTKEEHNRPVKGTGLGLNIVKMILENHKFDYGVESEEGRGSTFWVDFPALPSHEGVA